jgi:hypothetical protein
MSSSGMLRRVALVRIDFSEESSASIIRLTRIGEVGTTLAVTSNRRTLRKIISIVLWERRKTCIGFWYESQKERDHLKDRDVGGWITLRWAF